MHWVFGSSPAGSREALPRFIIFALFRRFVCTWGIGDMGTKEKTVEDTHLCFVVMCRVLCYVLSCVVAWRAAGCFCRVVWKFDY